MLTNRKPIYPVPEAIERPDFEGAYEIEDGYSSSVDLVKGRMVVSTGGPCVECGLDHARASRIHETGHAAFTPKDWEARVRRTKDKLPVSLVNACEDARIYARRANGGLDVPPPQLCEKEQEHYYIVRQAVRSGNMVGLAEIIAAAYKSGDEEPVRTAIARMIEELAAKADPIEQLKSEAIAKLYRDVYAHVRWHMSYRNARFRNSLALARDIIRILNNVATSLAQAIEDAELASQKVKVKEYGKGKKAGQPEDVKFGKMNVVELPMPNRSKAGFERRWTARDEGPIPTRFDRWSIDKRIFRAKKKGKGAAVLVDVSGSMAWSEEHLARVLDEVPAATIAIYSGSGSEGSLVVVARKGRCASMRQAARYMYGGNVVDGPALEWLAEQPETVKIWMSDGGITGIHDGWSGEKGIEYCGRILRKGGIQQVRNAEGVMEILNGKKPFVPSKKVDQRGW